jgi:large subunit ribosomal protein L25
MGDNKISLKVTERTVFGKKVKELRREGLTPVVVYGPGMEPKAVQAKTQELEKVVKAAGKHTPVHITLDDKKRIAMVKEIGIDPSRNRINHIAFHAVRQNKPIEAEVPVRLVGEGESEAEKAGLIILQNIDVLEVKALPLEMPDGLEIDIRHLKEAGERVLVSDIKLPENVELVDHADDGRDDEDEDEEEKPSILDLQVASVWEPSALQAQNEAAAGEAEDESEVEAENGTEEAAAAEGEGTTDEKKE